MSRETVSYGGALYRAADAMLVTPLRDAMNLLAKEFAASRVDDVEKPVRRVPDRPDILVSVRSEGCSGPPLQAIGWSGRHPHGTCETRMRSAASGGDTFVRIAIVLLLAWLPGVIGPFDLGDLVHVLLLVGLMLLLLGFLKAQDAAMQAAAKDRSRE